MSKKKKVIIHGFDSHSLYGRKLPESIEVGGEELIIGAKHGKLDWKECRGVITTTSGARHSLYSINLEKNLLNLVNDSDAWVVFLANDHIRPEQNSLDRQPLYEILDHLSVSTYSAKSFTNVVSKCDEFREFLKNYGIACNYFNERVTKNLSVIAESNAKTLAFESSNLFVLPFNPKKSGDINEFREVISYVYNGVNNYIKKRKATLPDWVDSFKFQNEIKLSNEAENIRLELEHKRKDVDKWRNYKLILTSSNDILRNTLIDIFADFFKQKIDPVDSLKEDFKILDEEGNPICVVEVKGTNKGVKREFINQVDSHRERSEIDISVLGLLIINNQMKINSIEGKLETSVVEEHIKHAELNNVMIMRTIDLLYLMKFLEDKDAKAEFDKILNEKAGWLKADENGYNIVRVTQTG